MDHGGGYGGAGGGGGSGGAGGILVPIQDSPQDWW